MSESTPMMLELDGADIHPHTVDPRVAADLLQLFFDLVAAAANVVGVPLNLRGLHIEDKCFLVKSETPNADFAMRVMDLVSGWANGTEPLFTKTEQDRVRRFNSAARNIGKDVCAKLMVGDREWPLDLVDHLPALTPAATTTLRVKLIDIGVNPSRARFESGSEEHPFSIPVDLATAEKLSKHFNRHLDLEFTFRRDRQGRIEDGKIIDFFPMETDDNGEEWLAWLKTNGEHWDDVNNALDELGRRDD